ncbi:MAG: hypothetical protein JWO86_3098 [Myxococcaceae bacterium]|nr:hypothetical protein [Myxococcaceae bacterium]
MTAGTSIADQGAPAARTSTPRWLEARGVAAGAVLLGVPSFITARMMVGGHLGRFSLLFFASYLVGAAALTRRSPFAQVVGRGIAWNFFVLQAWVLAVRAMAGDIRPIGALLVIAPALALVIARPLLQTAAARAAFAPRASRTLFLAAATASIASAVYAAPLALRAWTYGSPMIGAASTFLVAALVAQAAAVLRMRAWGVVLGVATAAGVLFALVVGVADLTFTAITAMPGLALAGAVGAAWLRKPTASQTPTVRIAATSESQQGSRVQVEADDWRAMDSALCSARTAR